MINITRYNPLDELFNGFWVKPLAFPADTELKMKVEVKEDKIELNEKVQFEFAKAELLPASKTLLNDVVKILKDHPEIEKIRVEGHTDNEASAPYNMKLSEKRAASVVTYLKSQGVEGGRMESKGFGLTKPIADNGTPDGREKNRRVEIHIVKRSK